MNYPLGAFRFNDSTRKLEYYDGNQWVNISTHRPSIGKDGLGRGLIANVGSEFSNGVHFINIPTTGDSQDFGDLTYSNRRDASLSSRTRGIFAGGNDSRVNTINFVTIATQANATDFGDLTEQVGGMGGTSNQTRGIVFLCYKNPGAFTNQIDFITIAQTGNAVDFGDSTQARIQGSHIASPTRAFAIGGYTPSMSNIIDFVTISTQGNAADFGDLGDRASYGHGSSGSATRGIIMGGASPALSPNQNDYSVMQFMTLSTLGNSQEFGSLAQARGQGCGISNSIRSVVCGGSTNNSANTATNVCEYVQISTQGEANDFGDMSSSTLRTQGCAADSHGGLG